MATPSAIKTVFRTIESTPITSMIEVKSIVQGIATRTTKIPDRLSVPMLANIRTKAKTEIKIYIEVNIMGSFD